ncbi:MAG TPA: hypothetical protein VEV41_27150 [Terriglobales bacterium]|nr:hypothetical protein [Terriglobales bacterium]
MPRSPPQLARIGVAEDGIGPFAFPRAIDGDPEGGVGNVADGV